jgi:capsular polysaccharide transport system permease protein
VPIFAAREGAAAMSANLDDIESRSSLQRNQAAAGALSVMARQLRFAKSPRSKLFAAAGLRPRRIDLVFRVLFVALVGLVLVVPNIVTILYFGVLASDQFQSETRFTVRTSEPTREKDTLTKASGIPSALIAQDTQIVANYLVSRDMLDRLQARFDFTRVFGRNDIDWYARLAGDAPVEDRLDYWQDMASASISPTSGIVTVKVRAFSAAEAHDLDQAVVAASEDLVNRMNDRIWADVTGSAREEVAQATTQLSQARAHLEEARNKAGILTVAGASSSLSALLTQSQGELIALENEYKSNGSMVSDQAPQMRVLASQIEAKKQQIHELQAQIASTDSSGSNLADRSTEFSQIELEQKLAEDHLSASITALEKLQYLSQQKLLYLDPFLKPTLPDEARYPRRFLWIGGVLAASLLLFAGLAAVLSIARTRLD